MLRLWPKKTHIWLFHEHCWVKRGSGPCRSYPNNAVSAPALLDSLKSILDDPANTFRPGERLTLTVSDSLASVIALPWQDGLRRANELNRYAQICFEKAALPTGGEWVMWADFRTFGRSGMAYAMRRDWLTELEQLCQQRGLRLARVLPASAGGYCSFRGARTSARSILLVNEASRTSALVYNRSGLLSYDVESITSMMANSAIRLLKRTVALYGTPQELVYWTVFPPKENGLSAISEEFPEIQPHILQLDMLC